MTDHITTPPYQPLDENEKMHLGDLQDATEKLLDVAHSAAWDQTKNPVLRGNLTTVRNMIGALYDVVETVAAGKYEELCDSCGAMTERIFGEGRCLMCTPQE